MAGRRTFQPRSLPSDASAPPRSFAAGTLPPGEILSMTCGSKLARALVVSALADPGFLRQVRDRTRAEHLADLICRNGKILSAADP